MKYLLALFFMISIVFAEDLRSSKFYEDAIRGDYLAQEMLGIQYLRGDGVPQDYKEAIKWFKLSAEQGGVYSQFSLGKIYSMGRGGIVRDYKEAIKWFKLSAEQGHIRAESELGDIYAEIGNYQEAIKCYKRALEKGDVGAQFSLGMMYYSGEGISKNYFEAFNLFKLATEQDYLPAQGMLGFMYYHGEGTRHDYHKAKEWFGKACDRGDQSSCDYYRELNIRGY